MNIFLLLLNAAASEYVEFDLDSSMSLGWEIEDGSVSLTLSCEVGWCGIGFGDSMVNTDMIIISFQVSDTVPSILDCWSSGYSMPASDTSLNGSDDLTLTAYSKTETNFIVTVKRPLSPTDELDYSITPGGKFNLAWAYRPFSGLSKHSTSSTGSIRMGYTQESSYFKLSHHGDFQMYGLIMTTLWGILAPIGVIIGRYFKWWKWWYLTHLIIFGIVVIMTIISANLVILTVKNVYTELDYVTIYHSRMGFTIACLVFGQGVLGLLIRVFQRFIKYISMITHLRTLHKILGWSMFVVGFTNVYTGWKMHEPKYLLIVIPCQAAVILCFVVLEIKYHFAFMKEAAGKIPEMTHIEAISLIKTEKRELSFFDDIVIDINSFKFTHPGGTFMLRDAIGEDLGKYLVGSNSYGKPYSGYLHSAQAFDMARHLAIGKVQIPESFFVPTLDNYETQEFTLSDKNLIAENVWMVSFVNSKHKMNSECLHLSWIGKHLKIVCTINKKPVVRYYSLFFTNLQVWKTELGIEDERTEGLHREDGTVQVIYKEQSNGAMTTFLTSAPVGTVMSISLPFGPGICASELSGHYAAFVAGTGIIPLIDLVYWMYKHQDNLEFTFTLVSRCRSWNDYYIDDALDATQNLVSAFKVIYCNSDSDLDLATVILDVKYQDPKLVWVCGPSGFNRSVINDLISRPEYPRNQIINF